MPGLARPRSVWTLGRAIVVAMLVLVSVPPEPVGAVESRGAATQDGWWNRLQGPAEAEPEGNPVRPLVPALPKPPTVPADSIAAGATAGQVDKVAAVGIDLTLADGDALDRLVLRLKQSAEHGANVGADRAKVIACPATVPWGPGQNAAWRDRPTADCSLGPAEGARADDGTWTFDLTAIGRLWADPFAPLARNGVVLSVDPAAGAGEQSPASPSVQVSWLNVESGNVLVELAATPGPLAPPVDAAPAQPGPLNAAAAPSTPTSIPPAPATVASALPTSGGRFPSNLPAEPIAPSTDASPAATGSTTPGPAAPAEPAAEASLSAAPDRPAPRLPARPPVDFWENVPGATGLLVPVTVGLAVIVGLALGPAGRPAPVFRREGGLSRALARRSAAGDGGAPPPTGTR